MPSTHRILDKKYETIDGEERLVNENNTHIVFVRPKTFVHSSGTTWANETIRLRGMFPEECETVDSQNAQSSYSSNFRMACARLHDTVKYY